MTNFNIRFIVIEVKIMFALRKYLASITNCMQQACLGLHINFLLERLLKQLTYFLFLENFRDPTPLGVVHSGRIWPEGITPEGP